MTSLIQYRNLEGGSPAILIAAHLSHAYVTDDFLLVNSILATIDPAELIGGLLVLAAVLADQVGDWDEAKVPGTIAFVRDTFTELNRRSCLEGNTALDF